MTGRELERALAIAPRLIADSPQEWRVGALTVVIEGQRARLRYARESVGTSPARATDIAVVWRRALDRLRSRSLAPDELLPRLIGAYARVARRRARVPLVEIRAELSGITRAQFAWDIARLQRERRLVLGDRRIDLGIATGQATARRSRVVWIEDDSGSGAYYESLRLVPQASSS